MIYLDNNATTRIDARVLDTMMPFLTDNFANASSTHKFGLVAHNAVKKARQQVADLLSCEVNEIVFTSGATEAINLSIKGVAETYKGKGKHIVTVQTEHKAVLDVCIYLEKHGYEITYLPVKTDGLIDLSVLKKSIRPDTTLVSVMLVNNETGVIQPIEEIAAIAHSAGALFMTDATQAVGKIPIDVKAMGIDILTFSAHKLYGPKGIGGLYLNQRSSKKVKIEALRHGGGHERGFRSGTLNVPGIIGLGEAAEIASMEMTNESKRVGQLRDFLESELLKIPKTTINGSTAHRLYNTTNLHFEGYDSDAIIIGLEDVAVSNGSACTAASINPSHVLLSLGLNETQAFSSLRFSLGRFNSKLEIIDAQKKIKQVIQELQELIN